MDIFVVKKRNLIIASGAAVICCILMVLLPTTALYSARKGISLWMKDVLPALLPFFICANFLQNIGVIRLLKSGVFPFAMSVLSGYPMGAKIIGDLRRQGEISQDEACRLLSFCSTSGPAFMIGAVGAGMLGSGAIGMTIACAHYLGALLNGFIYGKIYPSGRMVELERAGVRKQSIQEAFTEAIIMSLKSLGIILAYIVLFMFAADLMNLSGILSLTESQEIRALIKGIMEMTVGCEAAAACKAASDSMKCVICTFIISWGGFSIIGQTMSMLAGTGVSLRYVIITKLTHGLFSAVIAFLMSIFML